MGRDRPLPRWPDSCCIGIAYRALYVTHLARANERIRMDGVEIADDEFARLYFRVHDAAQQLVLDGGLPQMPSYFEILTAQACCTLPRQSVKLRCLKWAWAAPRRYECRGSVALSDYGYFS